MLIKENLDRSSQHLAMILVSKTYHKTHKYFLSLLILSWQPFNPWPRYKHNKVHIDRGMIALIFKSLTLQQEDMTNNSAEKKTKKKHREKKKEKNVWNASGLLSTNKSTTSKPTRKTLQWGNLFFPPYKNQATFHWDLIIFPTYLNWGQIPFAFPFWGCNFPYMMLYPSVFIRPTYPFYHSNMQPTSHLTLPNTPKLGQSCFTCIPWIGFSLKEGYTNDNISGVIPSQFSSDLLNFLSHIFHLPMDSSTCITMF